MCCNSLTASGYAQMEFNWSFKGTISLLERCAMHKNLKLRFTVGLLLSHLLLSSSVECTQTLHTLLSDEKVHSRREDVCHRHLLTLTVELRQSVPSLPKIVKSLPQNLAIAMSAWFRFVYVAARPYLSIAFSHAVVQQSMLRQT